MTCFIISDLARKKWENNVIFSVNIFKAFNLEEVESHQLLVRLSVPLEAC